MAFDDLRQWIAALDRAGQLKRIQTETDPILEIAEITDRVSKMHATRRGARGLGPALLFQNVKGHPGSQVLINQFGSEARMKLAVGVNSYDEIGARIRMFMDVKSPQGFLDKLKMLPLLTEAGNFFRARWRPGHAKKSFNATIFRCSTFRSCNAGRKMQDDSLRCPASRRAIRSRASAISACTACRSTTSTQAACTGSGRKSPPNMRANGCALP